jgi:hypothetical protein
VERSDAGRWSSALDATRRQSRRAQLGQRGALSERRRNWQRGANRRRAQLGPVVRARTAAIAPSSGSAAPFRTAV